MADDGDSHSAKLGYNKGLPLHPETCKSVRTWVQKSSSRMPETPKFWDRTLNRPPPSVLTSLRLHRQEETNNAEAVVADTINHCTSVPASRPISALQDPTRSTTCPSAVSPLQYLSQPGLPPVPYASPIGLDAMPSPSNYLYMCAEDFSGTHNCINYDT